MLTYTYYESTRYVRVRNPHTIDVPPQAMFAKLKGAATLNPDDAEQILWLSVLEKFIYDLSLCGDSYMTKEGYFKLREARLDFKHSPLGYLKYLTLEADWVREQLTLFKYMPRIRYRHISAQRIDHFGLRDKLTLLETSNWEKHVAKLRHTRRLNELLAKADTTPAQIRAHLATKPEQFTDGN